MELLHFIVWLYFLKKSCLLNCVPCHPTDMTALFISHTLGSLPKVKIDISRSHTPQEMDVLTKRRCWKVQYLFILSQSVTCVFLSLFLIFIVMYRIEQEDQQRASVCGFHQHISAICQLYHFMTNLSSLLIRLDCISKLPVSQLAGNRVQPRKTSFLQSVLLLFQLKLHGIIIDVKSVLLSPR